MVSCFGLAPILAATSLLAQAADGAKLPPPTRAAALMALIGIALLGLLLVVIILLGGHWTRRQGSYRRAAAVPPDRLPLAALPGGEATPEKGAGDGGDSGETVINRTTRHDPSSDP
jgi:hypothetical protein